MELGRRFSVVMGHLPGVKQLAEGHLLGHVKHWVLTRSFEAQKLLFEVQDHEAFTRATKSPLKSAAQLLVQVAINNERLTPQRRRNVTQLAISLESDEV